MPTTDELAAALRKADAAASAGDANAANDARRLAAALQKARTQAPAAPQSPAPQPVAPRAAPERTPWGGAERAMMGSKAPEDTFALTARRLNEQTERVGQQAADRADMIPSSPAASRQRFDEPKPFAVNVTPSVEPTANAAVIPHDYSPGRGSLGESLMGPPGYDPPPEGMKYVLTEKSLDGSADKYELVPLLKGDEGTAKGFARAAREDLGKAAQVIPQHVARAGLGIAEGTGNMFGDAADWISSFSKGPDGVGGSWRDPSPRVDLSSIKPEIPEDLQSVSGYLGEGFLQFLGARGLMGASKTLGGEVVRSGAATGMGFAGDSGRAADMIPLESLPPGTLRDFVGWLKTSPDDSGMAGRVKNMTEDAIANLLLMGMGGGAQQAFKAADRALTPRPRVAAASPAGAVPPPQAAAQAPQPSPAPVSQAPIPQAPRGAAVASPPAQRSPVGAPTPPAQVAAQAALPPPAGVMTPVAPLPQEAVDAFNAMPRKAREAMLRTMQSTGSDAQANTVMSRIWRGLTGQFGNSQEAMAQLRSLNNLPPEQQTMYALELMQRYGGDVETALPAMGRSWATGGGRKDQLFGGRDRAREIMDQNIPDQINSQGPRVTEIAEQKFGAGVVPAGEALEQELDALSGAYDNILSTKRNPTGRLRAQEKKDAVFKARDDLTAMLTSPEVMRTLPPNVKTEIMMQASEDRFADTITEAQVMPYLEAAMGRVVADVRRVLEVEVTQHQMDAIVAWVFNLGIGALSRSSQLLPAINSARWQDAASEMGAFLYSTTSAEDGKVWKRALRGLLIRRYTEACVLLGYDWVEACDEENILLPTEREWQPDWVDPESGKKEGRYYDNVLPTKTKFKDVLRVAQRYPLSSATQSAPEAKSAPALIPDTPASSVRADDTAGTPGASVKPPSPTKLPASPAPHVKQSAEIEHDDPVVSKIPPNVSTNPAATVSGPAAGPEAPKAAAPAKVPPVVIPAPEKPKEPAKPVAPPPLPKDAAPSSIEPKDMVLSKRFWGLAVTAVGTTNFLPRGVSEWINNEGNRELLTWLVVVAVGIILYKIGQAKAKRPLK